MKWYSIRFRTYEHGPDCICGCSHEEQMGREAVSPEDAIRQLYDGDEAGWVVPGSAFAELMPEWRQDKSHGQNPTKGEMA